jgi:hypothetical protein
MIIRRAVPVYASSLLEVVRCRLGAGGVPPAPAGMAPAAPGARVSLREVLERRITDPRKPRRVRHKDAGSPATARPCCM